MTSTTETRFLQRTARLTGAAYLLLIAAGIFAEFFVRSSLVVPGDAAATAANILARETLFRLGIAGDMVMLLCDVLLAWAFYVLLRPVHRTLALLAAFFRLAQAAVLGLNLLNLFQVLRLLGGDGYLTAFAPEQLQALALLFLKAHSSGYLIGLVFFGVSCLVLAWLIFRSGYLPRILGVLMAIAGVGYLVDSFAIFLYPGYEAHAATFQMIVFVPAFIGELALCLWLLIKGVRVSGVE